MPASGYHWELYYVRDKLGQLFQQLHRDQV